MVKEIFAFEKKKIILPAILVILLFFVLSSSAIYSDQLNRDFSTVVDNDLDRLKLTVYNAILNGTEPSIKNQLIDMNQRLPEMQNKQASVMLISGLTSALPEYFLNTFGTNFCVFNGPDRGRKECVATNLDATLEYKIFELVYCSAEFSQYFTSIARTNDTEYLRSFILSSEGQNIFDSLKGCKYTINDFLDLQNRNAINTDDAPLLVNLENTKIRIITSFDIISYIIILVIVGYIISCIIIYIHRKNKILSNKGKKVFVAIIFFFFVFLWWSFLGRLYMGDLRLEGVVLLILAYLATTGFFKLVDILEERSVEKKISKSKKK